MKNPNNSFHDLKNQVKAFMQDLWIPRRSVLLQGDRYWIGAGIGVILLAFVATLWTSIQVYYGTESENAGNILKLQFLHIFLRHSLYFIVFPHKTFNNFAFFRSFVCLFVCLFVLTFIIR